MNASLTELMPPIQINQEHSEPLVIISIQNVPENKGYNITQRARSSLGDRETIQVIRVDNDRLGTLIQTLQTLKAIQDLSAL